MKDIPFRRIDHLRFFVGNARQSAYFYRNAFGFDVVGYAGLETGVRHEASYVLRQGEITFVLVSPLSADHPENSRLPIHGDGVQDLAIEVDDVAAAYALATERGAVGVVPPSTKEDASGTYAEFRPTIRRLWRIARRPNASSIAPAPPRFDPPPATSRSTARGVSTCPRFTRSA